MVWPLVLEAKCQSNAAPVVSELPVIVTGLPTEEESDPALTTGARVSMVTARDSEVGERLPARSVADAVRAYVPSVKGPAEMAKLPLLVPAPTRVPLA